MFKRFAAELRVDIKRPMGITRNLTRADNDCISESISAFDFAPLS